MEEYRTIDLSLWHQTGQGGNGRTYENPSEPDVVLKINKPQLSTLEAVKHEFETSKAVERLGLPTPRMIEIVRVENVYAILSERVKEKKSISRICCDSPDRIGEMARLLCENGKKLFSTPCDSAFFPSRKEQLARALDKVQFIGKKDRQMLKAFADSVQDAGTCSHGDFNMGNLIIADGQPFWIDLDRFGYGDPMFDIGHLFQICNTYASLKQVQDIFHMNKEQLNSFWDAFAKAYTGEEGHSGFDRLAARFAALDMVLRYEFQMPSLAEKIFFAIYLHRLIKTQQ